MQRDLQYLQEMGITAWQIKQPEVYPDHAPELVSLPESCKLLLVAPSVPQSHDAWLFGKVLASMKLTPEQALYLPESAVAQLAEHQLVWCWFAGCDVNTIDGCRILQSKSLPEMRQDTASRRDLWQQICTYER